MERLVKGEYHGIPVAYLHGELDLATCPGLTDALVSASDPSTHCLIVDLTDVSYADSEALGCLLSAYDTLASRGGDLALVCCNENLQRLLAQAGFHQILKVLRTLDDAAQAMPECYVV